jgi:hypothetical protein
MMSSSKTAQDCFIIMPISDPDGYAAGHFQRVYLHAIRPAVAACGYTAIRADDVNHTNFIVVDLLQRVISAPVAICDLSARNPNVFFELGIRQAFDMPVVLIKDAKTDRVFDIQGLRTIEYDESLRVDAVADFQERLKTAIVETMSAPEESINSLIRLLSVQRAEIRKPPKLSQDTTLLLSAIRDLSSRIDSIESARRPAETYETSKTQQPFRLLTFLLPAEVKRNLEEIAKERDQPPARVAKELLSAYLSQQEPAHFETLPQLATSSEDVRFVFRVTNSEYSELQTRAAAAQTSIGRYIATVIADAV